ncbi:MAG: cell division protein FtsZ [bacterium]
MKASETIMGKGRIGVVGVGGGGCNTIGSMAAHWENAPSLIAINTDAQSLGAVACNTRLQIGKRITRNMGTGGDSKIGRLAADEDFSTLEGLFSGMDLVFIVCALGGGTGTGAAPVVARAAQEAGAMVIVFATIPFTFEGDRRMSQARQGLVELREQADVVIVIPNQSLLAASGAQATAEEAFQQADYYLSMGVFAIWKLLTQRNIINLDFATLRMVARCSGGGSLFSYGEGKGPQRAAEAIHAALHSPLLENGESLADSESILVSILGGPDMGIREVESIMNTIKAATRIDAHIHMGTAIDDAWQDTISVTIVASRYWKEENEAEESGEEKPDADPAPDSDSTATALSPPPKKRKRRNSETQSQLVLGGISKGLFKDVQPTIVGTEDMDVPTFIRKHVTVDK